MAKWKSTSVSQEVKRPDGSVEMQGVTVWIPINDAAKADKRVEKAIQLGAYTPKDPNERENMEKKLNDVMVADLRRKGLIPAEGR